MEVDRHSTAMKHEAIQASSGDFGQSRSDAGPMLTNPLYRVSTEYIHNSRRLFVAHVDAWIPSSVTLTAPACTSCTC
jgi:hypothetical protein